MEPNSFDRLARFAAGTSRRQLLRAGLATLAGSLLVGRRVAARQECIPPFILCDGECVYSLTSNEHCGTCGNACGQDVCVEGVCTSCESIGLTTCTDDVSGTLYCADLSTSFNNCGSCGNRCTTGPCEAGVCVSTQDCQAGLTECMGTCVDLQTDVAHCGACGNACMGEAPPGQSSIGECVAGVCQVVCLEGYDLCDGACVDLATDEDNCGACGEICESSLVGVACIGGECVRVTCPAALIDCGDGEGGEPLPFEQHCFDLSSDPNHCGACFHACASGECAAGVCVPAEDEEPFSLIITKWTCETDPGPMGFGLGEPPADCRPTGGITFEVAAAGGEVLDTCTIPAGSGGCNVEVPYGIGSVFVYEAMATAPAGYAPRENPIEVRVPDAPVTGEAPTAIFVNLPVVDEGDSTGGTVTLPNTGSGAAAGPDRSGSLAPAALAGAGVALAVAGWHRLVRRDATG